MRLYLAYGRTVEALALLAPALAAQDGWDADLAGAATRVVESVPWTQVEALPESFPPGIALTPSGTRIYTQADDGRDSFFLEARADGVQAPLWRVPALPLRTAFARSRDGARLAIGRHESVVVINAEDGLDIDSRPMRDFGGYLKQVALSGNGRVVVTVGEALDQDAGYALAMWQVGSARPPQVLPVDDGISGSPVVSHAGRLVALRHDRRIDVRNTESGALAWSHAVGRSDMEVLFVRDDSRVVLHGLPPEFATLQMLDAATGEPLPEETVDVGHNVSHAEVFGGGRGLVAASTYGGLLSVVEFGEEAAKVRPIASGGPRVFSRLHVAEDGSRAAMLTDRGDSLLSYALTGGWAGPVVLEPELARRELPGRLVFVDEELLAIKAGEGPLIAYDLSGDAREVLRTPPLGGCLFAGSRGSPAVLASRCVADALALTNVATGVTTTVDAGFEGTLFGAGLSRDGSRVAVSNRNGEVVVIDGSTGEPLLRIETGRRTGKEIVFSPDGGVLALYLQPKLRWSEDPKDAAGLLRTYDAASGALRAEFEFERDTSGVHRLEFADDGEVLYAGLVDGEVVTFGAATLAERARFATSPPGWDFVNFAFHPQAGLVAVKTGPYRVSIHELRTGALRQSLRLLDDSPGAMAFSPTGERVAIAQHKRVRVLWVGTSRAALRARTERIRLDAPQR